MNEVILLRAHSKFVFLYVHYFMLHIKMCNNIIPYNPISVIKIYIYCPNIYPFIGPNLALTGPQILKVKLHQSSNNSSNITLYFIN